MLIGCIIGPSFEDAKRQISLANQTCDGIELRLDLFEGVSFSEIAKLKNQIRGISILTGDSNALELDPDYLTIEWNHPENLSSAKTKIIRAYHNFDETPEDLEEIYQKIPLADEVKIACRAQNTMDSLRMLIFRDKQNFTGLCMGEHGIITRILGPCVNNTFGFARIESPAAPGQLTPEDLTGIYHYKSLNAATKIYGLIGNPVSQSCGNLYHNAFYKKEGLNAVYVKMAIQENEIPEFFCLTKQLPFRGLSVTMPLKEKLFEQIDHLDDKARAIQAINTLKFSEGQIFATNTDASGALDAIEEKVLVSGKKFILFGAGGSAKAIAFEAAKRGAEITVLSRRIEAAKELAEKYGGNFGNLDVLPEYDILVNTTPNPEPIPLSMVQPRKVVMDITRKHSKSPFMVLAKAMGSAIITGDEMFEKQAQRQFDFWFNKAIKLARTLS